MSRVRGLEVRVSGLGVGISGWGLGCEALQLRGWDSRLGFEAWVLRFMNSAKLRLRRTCCEGLGPRFERVGFKTTIGF